MSIRIGNVRPWAYLVVASSFVCFAYTCVGSITDSISSPVLKRDGWGVYVFSIGATCIGVIPSVWIILELFVEIVRSRTEAQKGLRIRRLSGFVGSAIITLTPLYVLERALPVSIVPFAAITCAILFVMIGWFRTRSIKTAQRIISLSASVLLILSMQYFDWNPRKPFLRDLYHIRIGMTVSEVRKTMHGYLDRPNLNDPEPNIQANDSIVYRPSNDPAYNADWGIVTIYNGEVQGVEYSSD